MDMGTEKATWAAPSPLDSHPHFKPFHLTPLDQSAPRVYIDWLLAFRLDDPVRSIPQIQKGVARLFDVLPILTGAVVTKTERKSTGEVLPYAGVVNQNLLLRVVYHDQSISTVEIPTAGLVTVNNQGSISDRLGPLQLIKPERAENPVVLFQVNVMTDGIALNMRFNHSFMDGLGAATLLEALGECCRVSDGEPSQMPTLLKLSNNEIQLRQKIINAVFPGSPTPSRLDPMGTYPVSESMPGATDAVPVVVDTRKFSFSASRIRFLKDICNECLPSGALSSNDILTALVTIAIHRARATLTPSAELVMAVNLRHRFRSPHFNTYLGNLATVIRAPLTGQSLTSFIPHRESGIGHFDLMQVARVASHIRQCLTSMDELYLSRWIASNPGRNVEGITHADIIISSLRHLGVQQINFGPSLGHITAFEMYCPPVNNSCVVLPQRIANDPTWVVNITMEGSRLDVLRRDCLLTWATDI